MVTHSHSGACPSYAIAWTLNVLHTLVRLSEYLPHRLEEGGLQELQGGIHVNVGIIVDEYTTQAVWRQLQRTWEAVLAPQAPLRNVYERPTRQVQLDLNFVPVPRSMALLAAFMDDKKDQFFGPNAVVTKHTRVLVVDVRRDVVALDLWQSSKKGWKLKTHETLLFGLEDLRLGIVGHWTLSPASNSSCSSPELEEFAVFKAMSQVLPVAGKGHMRVRVESVECKAKHGERPVLEWYIDHEAVRNKLTFLATTAKSLFQELAGFKDLYIVGGQNLFQGQKFLVHWLDEAFLQVPGAGKPRIVAVNEAFGASIVASVFGDAARSVEPLSAASVSMDRTMAATIHWAVAYYGLRLGSNKARTSSRVKHEKAARSLHAALTGKDQRNDTCVPVEELSALGLPQGWQVEEPCPRNTTTADPSPTPTHPPSTTSTADASPSPCKAVSGSVSPTKTAPTPSGSPLPTRRPSKSYAPMCFPVPPYQAGDVLFSLFATCGFFIVGFLFLFLCFSCPCFCCTKPNAKCCEVIGCCGALFSVIFLLIGYANECIY